MQSLCHESINSSKSKNAHAGYALQVLTFKFISFLSFHLLYNKYFIKKLSIHVIYVTKNLHNKEISGHIFSLSIKGSSIHAINAENNRQLKKVSRHIFRPPMKMSKLIVIYVNLSLKERVI